MCRNSIWPGGKRSNGPVAREDNTKLRTRMAARIALFALLSGEFDFPNAFDEFTDRHSIQNYISVPLCVAVYNFSFLFKMLNKSVN